MVSISSTSTDPSPDKNTKTVKYAIKTTENSVVYQGKDICLNRFVISYIYKVRGILNLSCDKNHFLFKIPKIQLRNRFSTWFFILIFVLDLIRLKFKLNS